jgi:outer membrane protein
MIYSPALPPSPLLWKLNLNLLSLSSAQEANARESLQIAEERYKLGQMSIFDLRAVQLGFAQAAQRRLSALYNLKVTEIELLALTGDLVQ